MLINALQRDVARRPSRQNPACVTIGFSGLTDDFDLQTSHILFGKISENPWNTSSIFDLPLIPYQTEAVAHAHGYYTPAIEIIYGGRGFAVPKRVEPEVVVYGIGPAGFNRSAGRGGEFSVTLSPVEDPLEPGQISHWTISSAEATPGVGSGYSQLVINGINGTVCGSPPNLTLAVAGGEPTLTARARTTQCNCNGSGAEFLISYTKDGDVYRVTGITILNGGSGYYGSDFLLFTRGIDDQGTVPVATFQATDGEITGVSISSPGSLSKAGVPTGAVTINNGGAYYKEDRTQPGQTYGLYSSQYGLTIDTDIESETFGQVTAGPPVSELPQSGPNNDWSCRNSCFSAYNGREYVVCNSDILGNLSYAPGVSVCIRSLWGSGASLEIRPSDPSAYDNKPASLDGTLNLVSGGSRYAVLGRVRPPDNLPLSASGGGSGASFSYVLQESVDSVGRIVWGMEIISVTGGSGYADESSVFIPFFSTQQQLRGFQFSATLYTKRVAPTIAASLCSEGSGAELVVRLEQSTDENPAWSISGVDVTAGGSGYAPQTTVAFTVVSEATRTVSAACAVAVADESGAITSVLISNAGNYYKRTDEPFLVSVTRSGAFYREDPSLPALVSPIVVDINQVVPFSQGDAAVITATVDSDPSSPTFGEIASMTVANGGQGYRLATPIGEPSDAGWLPTRQLSQEPILALSGAAPFGETERSCRYSTGPIIVELTSPDCNGARKASVILQGTGYPTDADGYRRNRSVPPQADSPVGETCGRAFAGEGAGDVITLSPADGLGGSAYVKLEGAFEDVQGDNCEAQIEENCGIRPPPERGDEISSTPVSNKLIVQVPVYVLCQWAGPPPAPFIDPAQQHLVGYFANFADDGTPISVFQICGECQENYDHQPPQLSAFDNARVRTICACDLEGFCFWRPAWDSSIQPVNLVAAGSVCHTDEVIFVRSTCNPLP
jgi:hypothetical protein